MRDRSKSPLFALTVSLALAASAHAADDEATALMRKADKAQRLKFEHVVAQMTLQEKNGAPRERKLESWLAQDEQKGDKGRIRFLEPAEIKGTGLLTLENPGHEDEQWLYLPAFKKTRRVGQSDLGDRFVGTDLFYEDMKSRNVDDYAYKLLAPEQVDGADCYVIESKPKAAQVIKESPYGKSVFYLRKDNLAAARIRFFDKAEKALKGIEAKRFVQVEGGAWRADETVITDVQRNHQTRIKVVSRDVKGPSDDAFSRQRLESE